ncbi:cytochrome c oxidase assembly protein [Pelagibius sp. Alg239-R121]|uniref:cytochrome c oxidase assembly protein n=1 Tax=Pelagibius sp. Alg239-R121 TaxID=2993448 RepID=UPI0024A6D8BC|nr:cytochrome c oxidase assembly protein [Pelagibius sp. Alg239-R121]
MADDKLQTTGKGRKNARTALVLGGVVFGMIGLSFATVPLYRLFCQVTGWGGTTQVADVAPAEVSERVIAVRFNADVNDKLPWRFGPVQREVQVKVGENRLAFYRAKNVGGRAVTGTATFNVTPLKAGQYFSKVACFCFTEQRLEPGQELDMPVSFFVDPAILDDPNLDDVNTITLSYTFFRDLDDLDESAEEEQKTTENRLGSGSGSATEVN